ncbi:MAG: DNA-3-methyladenine glycosylase [Thermoleophilaceae bacterium]
MAAAPAVVERDVVPEGPFRMPPAGRDGVLRRRGEALVRLLHAEGKPAVVAAWASPGAVRFRAEAPSRGAALLALERMRFAVGVDHDLSEFHRRFRRDPLIGRVVALRPWLRPVRRPEPFEALAWAVCEQLIDSQRAVAIQRQIVRRYGPRSACGTLRDVPTAGSLAERSPAELEACGLAGKRAIAMVRAAREVASGRADLAVQHEPAWQRLRTISNIGAWTLEKLAFEGQGRDDQLPAGDLKYVKLVGRLAGLGRRAAEDEVRAYFAPYEPFAGLAGTYALGARYV